MDHKILLLQLSSHSPVRNGHIKRVTDPDIQSSSIEIIGINVSTSFISAPLDPKGSLGIKFPFLVLVVKNVKIFLIRGWTNHPLVEEIFHV